MCLHSEMTIKQMIGLRDLNKLIDKTLKILCKYLSYIYLYSDFTFVVTNRSSLFTIPS